MAGGGRQAPPPLDEVRKACDQVLADAGKVGSSLVTAIGAAVTADDVLNGMGQLLGPTVASAIDRIREGVGWLKKKALAFLKDRQAL